MPDCEYCGDSFGNDGALASHEAHCDDRPEESAQAVQETATAQPAQDAQAQPPARQEAQQGGGNLPAPGGDDAIGIGMQMGQALASAHSGDPEEQARAKGALTKAVGSMIASAGEQMAQEQVEGAERAKNASQDDISKADEYVDCPECSGQLTNLPPAGQEFQCPHCGTVLRA